MRGATSVTANSNCVAVMVVDASVVVEILCASPLGRTAVARVSAGGGRLQAPHLLGVEVASVLRRLAMTGEIDEARASTAVTRLVQLGVTRFPHEPLLPRVWELRHNLSTYDAMYVALAESLDAPLLTLDGGIARAPGHRAEVQLLS